jgi:hypothetical protein
MGLHAKRRPLVTDGAPNDDVLQGSRGHPNNQIIFSAQGGVS